jgi:RND family efflux transporter MFP subunit
MSSIMLCSARQALGTALTLSMALAGCSRLASQGPEARAPQVVQVQVQTLQPGAVEDSSEFIGVLEAEQRVEVRPEVSGRVTQVLVSSGSAVRQGQPLVRLSPNQVQAEVASAQAGAQAAQFGREAAQAQLAAAQSQVSRTQADVELALVEFRRAERLVEAGALSRQELDNAQNQLNVSQAAQRQAEDNVRVAQAQLQQALSTFDQAQAQVNVNQESLGLRQVVAPVAGRLGDISLRVGDFVETGDTLGTIIQNNELFLRLQVPTAQASQLRLGLPVELINPDTSQTLATGSLSFIAPEVTEVGQTILVKARFPNEVGSLRDGQFVRARLIWSTNSALLVPTVAVSRIAGQSFVFVATDQPQANGRSQRVATQRPVQLGPLQGNSYPVVDGLVLGEEVIVTNILQLRDGVPIAPTAQTSVVPFSGQF